MMLKDKQKKGFTLIELLVVIAIIAVLAAILFPVYSRVREKSRQSSCLSNLRQIGIALRSYIEDYTPYFPYSTAPSVCPVVIGQVFRPGWVGNSLQPYMKNIQLFQCPSGRHVWVNDLTPDPNDPMLNDPNDCPQVAYRVDYSYNYRVYGSDLPGYDPLGFRSDFSLVEQPTQLAMFWDSANPWMMWGNTLMLWTLDVTWFENKQFDRTHWHNETNNFLFADGHAKAMKFTNMTWANFFNYGPEDAQYNYPITRRP
jgi:prepilin-type N-terminal cleavage/methylation domain-containing protein/prepilin-type processing-associated H-X9-DG protein